VLLRQAMRSAPRDGDGDHTREGMLGSLLLSHIAIPRPKQESSLEAVYRVIVSIEQAATQRPNGHDRTMPQFDQRNPSPADETAASGAAVFAATQELWEHQKRLAAGCLR
jgi:hypothetical protein